MEHRLHGGVELRAVGDQLLQSSCDVIEGFGQDRIDGDHRPCDGLQRAGSSELESVAGEREGARPVTIARICWEHRERVHADLDLALLF